MQSDTGQSCWALRGPFPMSTARCAQHAAGNLDNRHVEIVCAASAHVNVSVLYQFVDTASSPWPTSVAPAWRRDEREPRTDISQVELQLHGLRDAPRGGLHQLRREDRGADP